MVPDAMGADAFVAAARVARAAPIAHHRRDGKADEAPPPANLSHVLN